MNDWGGEFGEDFDCHLGHGRRCGAANSGMCEFVCLVERWGGPKKGAAKRGDLMIYLLLPAGRVYGTYEAAAAVALYGGWWNAEIILIA